MTQEYSKKRSLKSWLAIIFFTVVILVLTASIESNLNTFQVEAQKSMFSLETKGSQLMVNYKTDSSEEVENYDNSQTALPRYLVAKSDLTISAFGNTFISLKENTEVRVIIFNKNRLHISLIDGELELDNRLSSKAVTVQAKNTLLKPYERGVYLATATTQNATLESVEGQAIVGIYENAKLVSKELLPRSTIYRFPAPAKKEEFNLNLADAKYPTINADKLIQNFDLFSSKYKNKTVEPDKSKPVTASITKALTFNDKKKQFLNLYPYQKNILASASLLTQGSAAEAKAIMTQANEDLALQLAKSPKSLSTFKLQLARDYEVIAGLSSLNDLNPLKENIENEYQNYIVDEFYMENLLSLLNDSFILFVEKKTIPAEEKIKLASNLITKLSDEDKKYVIQIIDNIAEQAPDANYKQLYELRQNLYSSIKTKSDSFKDSYEDETDTHIERLKRYLSERSVSTGRIKDSALVLINSLNKTYQLKHEDFIDELNIQGIKLGF